MREAQDDLCSEKEGRFSRLFLHCSCVSRIILHTAKALPSAPPGDDELLDGTASLVKRPQAHHFLLAPSFPISPHLLPTIAPLDLRDIQQDAIPVARTTACGRKASTCNGGL